MSARLAEPHRLLTLYMRHGKRERCYECGNGTAASPLQPEELCCMYGHALLARFNRLMTSGWDDMEFWDGEPEGFVEPQSFPRVRSWGNYWLGKCKRARVTNWLRSR